MSVDGVVIFSGGMDSFTVLHKVLAQGLSVAALTFDYGQRHHKEIHCAQQVCQQLAIEHQIIDLTAIEPLLQGSSLLANAQQSIPHGHYQEQSMQSTVVPNRNMILLSLAIGYGVSLKADQVFYGAHGGDHAIYPDCRAEFVDAMNQVAAIANYQSVHIEAPYLHQDKRQILADGLAMGLDYGQTWTCYQGEEKACGRCGSCVERLEAFAWHQQIDPLPYQI